MDKKRYTSRFSQQMQRWIVCENGKYLDSDAIVERLDALQAKVEELEAENKELQMEVGDLYQRVSD